MKQEVATMYKIYDLLKEQIDENIPCAGYRYDIKQ